MKQQDRRRSAVSFMSSGGGGGGCGSVLACEDVGRMFQHSILAYVFYFFFPSGD